MCEYLCVCIVCVFSVFWFFFSKEKKKGSGVERRGETERVWEGVREKESDLNIVYENRFIFNKMCFFIKR